ncbi:DUF1592 domain-containing protein [Bremerella sp. T1]|uniref:DUF1592 domain-containing protein n=1 Tax=Bremerella sp. TYQ1 TaxID=3119568 RepID=UPI001CCAC3D4|nr:DUF1592 domain-containing protein [Bremerella volcania]UBM36726.1 DUF1592 domain-containing protein [Bremerella volcania]
MTGLLRIDDWKENGPAVKRVLDVIESHQMPPREEEQPSDHERVELQQELRRWLKVARSHSTDWPGKPVLRRLTRLEYNNTVRDLLGLDTDVFIFSERLPFQRDHFQPATKEMPGQFRMSAREYGAKYPVFLMDAGIPGDSRADSGFVNRGDAQDFSAARLEEYIKIAGEIAFHPDLLTRAKMMEELFPSANYSQPSQKKETLSNSIVVATSEIAPNSNVTATADASAFDLASFQQRIAIAKSEGRGGVFDGECLTNSIVPGKGGVVGFSYGMSSARILGINPTEDWWIASFGTAEETSGKTLFANRNRGQKQYELAFHDFNKIPFSGVSEIGLVLLSRKGESGSIRIGVRTNSGDMSMHDIDMSDGKNIFVALKSPPDSFITRLVVDGQAYSGDYVLLDDLAIITRDPPVDQGLVMAEEPIEPLANSEPTNASAKVDKSIAQQSSTNRIEHFLRRAFRRPVPNAELALFATYHDQVLARGGSPEDAMRSVVQAVLSSPSFLYLNAPQPEQESTQGTADHAVALTAHELATRLSYFLWSTMPDDELSELADSGRLLEREVLDQQVQRMLADPRAIELSESFYVQWLKLQELWSAQPDVKQFPQFYSAINNKRTLAQDMFGEVLLLFQAVLVEDRSVVDLLDSDYTFVNGKMVQFYKLNSEELTLVGAQPRAIDRDLLKDDRNWFRIRRVSEERGGVVTSPAILTATSLPHRTSPIRRGVWLLETLFNRHLPPPNVAVGDIEDQEGIEGLSLREKVELHRANHACAVCHDQIDPPGFALENFDAIGKWRVEEQGMPIDSSGQLPGVGKFGNPLEFKQQLIDKQDLFARGFAEHLFSYALSRDLEYYDVPAVQEIVSGAKSENYRFSSVVRGIVQSDAFRTRRSRNE